jgi:hypothetical protein
MKLISSILLIFSNSVLCDVSFSNNSAAFYIGSLIRDWNLKNTGSNLVVIYDISGKSELVDEILTHIPEENSVVVIDNLGCWSYQHGRAEFIIIVSGYYSFVS